MARQVMIAVAGVMAVFLAEVGITMWPEKTIYEYVATDEVFFNPLMGYAPSADDLGRLPESSLVYVDITWEELEPEEGIYDWASIEQENHLGQWREEGKHVVLRFVCDIPSDEAHRDIPDWLYEKTGDGRAYDMDYGRGYSPNYENETLIQCHERAIKALGSHFGADSFVAYVQLGSLGHWGEWHVKTEAGLSPIPKRAVRERYIRPYREAFPKAKILMRRPFGEAKAYGFGVYNDMTGKPDDTAEWLTWIREGGIYDQTGEETGLVPMPDVWNTAPIGGEFTSSLSMRHMLRTNLEQTERLVADSHMTFIGPKLPKRLEDGTLEYQGMEVLRFVGYRYRVSRLEIRTFGTGKNAALLLTLTNDGVAPMYWDWAPCLYLMDGTTLHSRYPLNIKLSTLTQGASAQAKVTIPKELLEQGTFDIGIGIENPDTGQPEVFLPMKAERRGTISILKHK